MKQINLALGMLLFIPLLSCGNAESKTTPEYEKEKVIIEETTPVASVIAAVTSTELEKAKKDGKTVFLIVYDKEGADKDKAIKIAKDASSKKAKVTTVVELNITDKANSDLITKYRLAGAPMPLLLVIDKNGIAAGGMVLADATVDGLLKIIPSAKYSEVLKAINEQKGLLIVAYKKDMINKSKAIENCKKVVQTMSNSLVLVELNMDDANEAVLIKQLNVSSIATEPIIYAINKSGQVTGTFDIKASTDDLKNATNKVIKSGGCGTGGCAPGKKC